MRYFTTLTLDTPIAVGLQVVSLQLSGLVILLILIGIGAYIGWLRGIRAILTVALFSVIAYLICVQGGELLVGIVNRFYQNGPKLAAFAIGRDPSTAPALDPLITPNFTIPLFFRFVLFVVLVASGWFFNARPKWYKSQPDLKNEPLSKVLGAFVGGFTALIWVSAATAFWIDLLNSGGGFGGPIANVLYAIPDVTAFVPALITIFFLLLVVIIAFNLPKLWKA